MKTRIVTFRKLISLLSYTNMKIDIQNTFHFHSLQATDC